ncbi:MAG: MBL fold metallo-hydrolase [Desulfobacteraceae bacterium]|jgi:7,8-dihydropterin-6-yl-methyl-4-(beta-D-ribofuranosyl)aminobenzene 5'-phosphate synthase
MVHPISNSKVHMVILVDNLATKGLLHEHGFSLWIDMGSERILFDTGQGPALVSNLSKLNIDCSRTDHLVLSHGHYDHTGGLRHVLDHAPPIHVHCHPGVVQPRYSIHRGTSRSIKMPRSSGIALNHLPATRLHWVLQPTMLSRRVGLSGPIPRLTAYEDTGGPFYLDPEGRRPDPITDDLALWIRTGKGLVVCLGCCHAGLINTLDHILQLNPGQRINTVIGGFHLLHADNDRLQRTVSALRKFSPERIIACHCTGEQAVAVLRDNLGERVSQGAAGKTYAFSP